jgi:hypothetical protein
MRERALFATLLALLLPACGEGERALWDQLDSGYRAECAPQGEERVLHAWKGGKRYCFRYTIERIKPREGPVVIVAQGAATRAN